MSDNVLVETDFLFALRPSDSAHEAALSLLRDSSRGVTRLHVSPVSSVEASLIMKAARLDNKEVSRALKAMEDAIRDYTNALYPELSLTHLAVAAELRDAYGLTFFDSVHACVALSRRLTYVSSDTKAREAVISEGGKARPL